MSRIFEVSQEIPSHHRLTRSAAVMGAATFASRVLGFVRDILMARFFGTTIAAQAFVIAFMIPNLLRDLAAEGAVSAAIIPTLASTLRRGEEAFWELSVFLLNAALFILGALSVLGVVFAPLLVTLVAPGFLNNSPQFELTVLLTRVIFPFLFLIGLSAYAMGVLNTLHHFFVPALGPSLLNLGMIGSFFFLVPYVDPPILGLALGVLLGGVIQFLIQIPLLRKEGFRYHPSISFRHPGMKQAGRLILPRIFGSAIYQLSVVVDRVFASLGPIVGEGGVAALYYSNRIIQLPFALFGVSIATAALPTLSEQAHDEGLEAFRGTVLFSLQSVFFVMVPAVVGTLILARPIVQILFERGIFDTYSTHITTNALFYYVMGLLSFSGAKILASAFYSLQDTRTPVKVGFLSLALNVVLNAVLMFPMKIGGIALATSLSSTFDFVYLYFLLKKRIGSFGGRILFRSFCKQCAAGSLMALSLFWAVRLFLEKGMVPRIPAFLMMMVGGGVSYYLFALMVRVEEAKRLLRWVFKKR